MALSVIDRGKLSEADRLNFDLFKRSLSIEKAGKEFPQHLLVISQMDGIQRNVASTLRIMPARKAADYENILARTRLKTLTEQTIRDNARFFENENEVPRYAITMGVGTILEARHCLFLANGEKKADTVTKAIEGPITSMITASALQLHPNTTVILDQAAASKLELADYYEWVYRNKP
jgi:uncharacterized protein (DUF885 family)